MDNANRKTANLAEIFNLLLDRYGPQHWWPAEHEFEMILGAVLTQNTSWTNVELALDNLRHRRLLDYRSILKLNTGDLESLIQPAGFFRRKASTIRAICVCLERHQGIQSLRQRNRQYCREVLLNISGIGAETADAILLYALDKPAFVIDKYSKRIIGRLNALTSSEVSDDSLRQAFIQQLSPDLAVYQEYHALLVEHAKLYCRKTPICTDCPLQSICEHYKNDRVR